LQIGKIRFQNFRNPNLEKWRYNMNHIFGKKRLNNIIKIVFFLIIFFLISSNLIFSQINEQKKRNPPDPNSHHEVKDDDYIPVSRDEQGRSPAYNYIMSNITTVQVNVDGNGLNIVGDAANEPSIAVDPNDRNRMAIGWRQFNTVSSNFRQAGYGFTTNGGQTWTFPGVIEPGIFRSDPVLDYDIDGNFYYNSLTNNPDYYCKVFKSSNGGSSWDSGTDAQGGDKQWMTIDKTNGPGTGHIYAFWTSYFSTCYPEFFTRSSDNGGSFENCVTIPDDPSWGTLTVGSNGNLYVGGTSGTTYDFVVAKSTNAQISGQTVTWDMATIVSLDGSITYGIGPNPGGLGGQTSIAVDTSNGPYHGNVYLLCSVERNSNPDPADVMFTRSTDGGVNWSSPVKVNDDASTTAYQWFGTMSVAPTGRIDVIWLDTRDNPGSYLSALYYSNSTDGGTTWSQNERLSDFFDPHVGWPQQNKMGDYFHMVSDNNGASLAWAATFNNEQDVYYSYIADITTFQLSVDVTNGWNMVSIPGLHPTNQNVDTWWAFRDMGANVFKYAGGYQSVTNATPGEGYWLKQAGDLTYNTGEEWPAGGIQIVSHDPIAAASGWNLIGGYELSVGTAGITTNPSGLQDGPVYKYAGGYQVATTLDPGYGYWIKLTGAGQIIIPAVLAKGTKPVEYFPEDWGKIVLTDAAGVNSTLYTVKGEVDLNQYELPPAPPAGMIDIRFGSGRIAENINSSIKIIEMSGITYPLTVRVENMDMRIQDETGKVINTNLKSGEDVVINDATIQKLMVSGELIPDLYALEQNYPNPFNPSTTIKFALPQDSKVNLTVFNILGEEVGQLINQEMKAGYHQIEFNASHYASGVYLYSITAGDFVETKKMVLMK
jgi:hypothetical protein